MSRIKIITDSVSDITREVAAEHNIHIIGFNISLDGKQYKDGTDITRDEFYQIMDNSSDFPKTSQLTFIEIGEVFKKYYDEGYSDLIYCAISSTGSATYANALKASEEFFEENPEAKGYFNIYVKDSLGYTAIYGYPVIQAAVKAEKGCEPDEILAFLDDWFSSAELYFVPYTLEYVKRSGRLSAAAAFVGELLGLKPVIKLTDGQSHVPEKIRGEKNIIPKVIEIAKKNMIPQTPYVLIAGSLASESAVLEKEITKALGYPPEFTTQIGPTVACHAGHKVVGIMLKGQSRK